MLNASSEARGIPYPSLPSDGSAFLASELLLSDQSLDRLLRQVSEEVSRITDFPVVTVQLYDPSRRKVIYKGLWGIPESDQQIAVELPIDVIPYGAVIRQGMPQIQTGGVAADDRILGWLMLQTVVCMPIKSSHHVVGTVSLGHPEPVQIEDSLLGKVEGLLRLAALVIERKQAEKTLKEAERFLQSALDSLSANVAILDSEGFVLSVNYAWRQFGSENHFTDRRYGIGTNYLDVCDAAQGDWSDEAATVARGIRDVIGSRRSEFYLEYPCHSPEQKRWFTMRATRFDWAGYVRVIVSHQNVTDLKQTAERLRESEQQVRTILNNVVDGILTTDENGIIEAINPAGAQIFGYAPMEIIGCNINVLLPEMRGGVHPLANLAASSDGQRLELMGRRHDGSKFPMYVAVSEARFGERCLYTAIIQDLTERKRAEAERVEKERLHVALEKEKELRELKNSFVSTISHELRTPLSAIMLASDMLYKFGDLATPDEKKEYLETIKAQTAYLAEMVSDVMRLSKSDIMGPDFKPEWLSLEVVCRGIVDEVKRVHRTRHDIVFVSKQRPIHANVDPKLLRHALINLLQNAIKYSPDGGEVRMEMSRKRGQVIIRVSDQGIGIPPEDLDNLFTPFHRASNTEAIVGTGLGLYIAKQAVELHQGRIAVESEVGVGTTFTIYLPIMQSQ